MSDFLARIARWFQGQAPSREVARNRLQLILIQDRSGVDPGILDSLREDLVELIERYFHISEEGIEVELQRDEDRAALIANIPIVSLKARHRADIEKAASPAS
ncbi:cell division topological specificity factor MinE [Candidatus Poribacteria bacterium]|nr:cell division topological specificity factor MinE [Candidatus Poribacteria bacterium]